MHVAIIMDGNGRWAEQRGLPRKAGHGAGARAVRRVVEAATQSRVDCLTLYAFSSDNWSRPADEVEHLMRLFKRHLQSEVSRCVENGVRLNVIGRRDRLNPELVRIIERAEALTARGRHLLLRLAVDYSARDAVARSAHALARGAAAGSADVVARIADTAAHGVHALARSASPTVNDGCSCRGAERACFEAALAAETHAVAPAGDVDLLIRSGGERRLSDFMLWECAYAELVFVETYWPDFTEHDLAAAIGEFGRRERRFGGLPVVA